MCLILVGWRTAPEIALVLAANRDEFHGRPAAPARYWEDAPEILGGRDLQQGGTWLAMDRRGRFAAVANYREPELRKTGTKSRGFLVSDFLRGTLSPEQYLAGVAEQRHDFDPFNLIAADAASLWYFCSREAVPRELPSGLHAISNGALDSPWPKVIKAKAGLQRLLGSPPAGRDPVFALLSDRSVPEDRELPDTGIGLEWERKLAPIFVSAGDYGTRSSTVIARDAAGRVEFEERGYDREGALVSTATHQFTLSPSPSGRGQG